MTTQPTASIIVLTYNNLEYTRQCLNSIFSKTDKPNFEVVVVDNASKDGTPEFLKELSQIHPNVKLILSDVNHGFAQGNNIGVESSSGEYIVFLNNDTVVTRNWLEGLLHPLQDRQIGMVGPVTNNIGNESRISVDYEYIQDMDAFAQKYTASRKGQLFEINMLALFCAAMRRAVFDEIGPLDERFDMGMFEDDDYALRLHQHGYKLLCTEEVFIHHWGSRSFSSISFARYWETFAKNRREFEKKWGMEWKPSRYREELIDLQIAQLVDERTNLALAVIERQRMLEDIFSSQGWKLLTFLRSLQAFFAPSGSRREHFLKRIMRAESHKTSHTNDA